MDEGCFKTKKDGSGSWYTAGYVDSEHNQYYFAQQGKKGRKNKHGIYWYPTLQDARDALERVMSASKLSDADIRHLESRLSKDDDSHSKLLVEGDKGQSQSTSGLPVLQDPDWVDKSKFKRCKFGDKPGACKFGSKDKCRFWHVDVIFGNKMGHFNTISKYLVPDDVFELEKNGHHTAAYTDRSRNKIIYAEGGNSRVNYQGIHWYKTISEARRALEKTVSSATFNRG